MGDNKFKILILPNMGEGELVLSIPTASDKLRQSFPNDPRADIQIEFKQKVFRLVKAHLRLQSNYFRKHLTVDRSILAIEEDFNETFFSNILECLYGAPLRINRKDVLEYFPILQFLEIDCLLAELKQDMVDHTSDYNLFRLFDAGYRYSDQQIFEKCLLELEYHDYLQLKQHKQEVLGISQELFKLLIKSHNRLPKDKRPLNPYEVNQLIIEYCDYNKLQPAHRNSLKFEMIDKNNLSSHEYRDIFINDGYKTFQPNSRRFPARALSLNPRRNEGQLHPQSLYNTTNLFHVTHKNLYLEMDTTFLRKISEELIQEKEKLIEEIKNLREVSITQNEKSKHTKRELEIIRKKINDKLSEQTIADKMKSIDSNLSEFQKSMSSQSQRLQSLFDSTNEMFERCEKEEKQLSVSQSSCNSSLWNINDKNQKITDFVLIKNENKSNANRSNASFVSKSESQIKEKSQANISLSTVNNENRKDKENKSNFYLKQSRLEFSKEPLILKHPKEVQVLANLINPERFTKKKLKIFFRGERGQKKSYSKASQETTKKLREQLQGRRNVLFLLRTDFDKLIGAFCSSTLDLTKIGDFTDENAFIFTVTEGKKFDVNSDAINEAIQLNPGYIICFGTDLMISENLYEVENYCAWPSNYQGNTDKKEWRADWFVEDSQFGIKEIECYQVEDEGGDMMVI